MEQGSRCFALRIVISINKVMDWWLKTGTMKRKLNEKASDRQGEGATARWFSLIGHYPAAELHSNSVFFSRCGDSKMITIFCVVLRWIMTTLNYEKLTTRLALLS